MNTMAYDDNRIWNKKC